MTSSVNTGDVSVQGSCRRGENARAAGAELFCGDVGEDRPIVVLRNGRDIDHTYLGVVRLVVSLGALLVLGACSLVPQRAHIATEWRPSFSYDERRPSYVILHHTGSDEVEHALATLTTPAREVSAHYLVARDGRIWQLVDERARAWHAGEAYWAGITDINSISIGIELDNDGREAFADPQIAALIALLADVTRRNFIPAVNVLGHGDVAPARKVDPSAKFPWRRLAQSGFGFWCDTPPAALPVPIPTIDPVLLLQAFGYDIRKPEAAIAAFHRHFRGSDSTTMSADDVAVLQCLVRAKGEGQATFAPRATSNSRNMER